MVFSFNVSSSTPELPIVVGTVRGSVAEERVSLLGFDPHGERDEFQTSNVDDEEESDSYLATSQSNMDDALFSPSCTTNSEGAGSKESSKYSIIPASEEDIATSRDLILHSHPFGKVKTIVSQNSRLKKKNQEMMKADKLCNDSRQLLVALGDLPSCFNTQCGRYIKCTCAKKLQAIYLGHGVEYLSADSVV
jgi:hypothetical protein